MRAVVTILLLAALTLGVVMHLTGQSEAAPIAPPSRFEPVYREGNDFFLYRDRKHPTQCYLVVRHNQLGTTGATVLAKNCADVE